MGKETDSASSLEKLAPTIQMPYAIYIKAFDPYGSPNYKEPYRRYATKAHRKVAAAGLRRIYGEVRFYNFNYDNELWEEVNER